ncbi:hypothetical protein PW52_13335 [Tamlana sedimentorum]|uniref:Carbohydrate-binding protein SusD n=1 Tax=Neotamlana sedimentorum TaxID=1435349 RepID=A0A0D7WAU8_9FLAO|nr:RagB/SusD family nutrient uptake outer membrane protein [Tamlana sedimentorum]KJD34887.1 hypothetical protein PW52_13335 [Tamlana sedimentorum]
MKKAFIYILVIAIGTLFNSCDEFLEESPSKTSAISPDSLEDYEAILNNYTQFYREGVYPAIFGTDDFGLMTELHDNGGLYNTYHPIYATWDSELAADAINSGWSGEWRKIFMANLVLAGIEDVEGSEEDKANIIAECHFIRAYSYFVLANVFCLPNTEANSQELGLPVKETTSFDESIQRANLEDTYKLIESDLQKALEITSEFGDVNDLKYSWRANTAAVNGFAARYYLSLNDYETAQSYAQKSLDEYSFLRNYNTDMRYSDITYNVTIFNPDATQVEILYPYTRELQSAHDDRLEFGEMYYYRMMYNGNWAYWPSQELLDLYDQTNDLRYKYHVVEDYSYDRGATNPPYSYPGYVFFFRSDLPSGPSVSEMLLIKAECQIRQGVWAEGLETANILRAARMNATADVTEINLSASSQQEALIQILEERRRELPFVHRWYDIRRYNNNSDATDDVIMSRTFYPFNANIILSDEEPVTTTLDINSRKFAYPIPNEEILISKGALEQNQY